MSYYNEEFETLPRQALEALQLKRLQATVARVCTSVPFYRQSFDRAGITPDSVKSLADLQRLPFTLKQNMRDSYPYGLFAAPMEEIVRIHASSGTTGKPTVVGYTRKDIDTWSELMARSYAAAGVHRGDIIHNSYGYGLFTGGLGAHYGAEKLGASVIPMSGGNTKKQILIMKDFGSTVLTCTPSYSLFMSEAAREEGVDFRELKLRVGIFGAEPWSEAMRSEIEEKLNLCAIDIYGLSEIMGPGVAIECCEAKKGLHIWEDHFIPEIINPETGEVLPEGERGELVITTITKEGIPLIRYRTRDITSLTYEPCACGRTHARLTRMTGRSDDMLIIRGVNVFPSQIESILMGIEGVEPHYVLIVDRKDNLDSLEVQVEVDERLFSDEIKVLQSLSQRVEKEIKDILGISCRVRLVEPQTITRSEGKAKRVIDNRKSS
ncbi:Phenylacetate--CoA ligase [Geobacter metallireducens RCH3]|uniref:Phenylacetate-coenzyme A ligase n=1 Tax=Geobacter metallireducens (strain ATCC 53774 / DSM 7210 / GS-15) TaxID=269799 RepID=Q39UM0_GEOMG|nr:phenylacetate--CoA ligase [Geobacter metallireducens]ABB32054.1 phenylacetate--coenzyme A ligase [Geobacter metallireducens GS-15]EHP88758.1 Phenylacetate--CoA ligase [Geobacter metallireducens RCH3]